MPQLQKRVWIGIYLGLLVGIGTPAAFGRPGFDPKGRLIYRSFAQNQPRMTQTADGGAEMKAAAITSDSSAIVRFDLDSRTADTVAWMNTPNPGQMSMSQKPDNGGMTIKLVLNPFQRADEWAMLTDGSVAVVRVHDYHIDWVRPDGTKLSTEKMPVLWRRYEDKDKQHYADSIKTLMDSVLKKQMATAASQPGAPKMDIRAEIVPEKEWPDYYAPIKSGAVLPDLDNRLWLLPTASEDAGHGYIYDVVACGGGIVERVQLPVGRVVAGFGPGGTIYLAHTDGKVTYLERTRLAVPKSATAGGGQ